MLANALPASRNARTGLIALGGALLMLGLGFASVPLYRIFCQVTGFGGTTMQVTEAEAATVQVAAGHISVRFDANVDRDMPWKFAPQQVTQDMRIGTRKMAFYKAENLSDKPVTGVASFNVEPEYVGKYFNKIQCFCFELQTLQPGQSIDMPVIYYIDPKILDDPDAKNVEQITLSYTFHVAAQ
ncbi:cytochrome c oxidase assembly protein [Novosphingobium sp.]|uniref:cytochrome c oxidase assembly protein n=1 Tax=Novosphingobium sp. TaxID=1874826 RepID=UPI002735CB18|nr:cytochrome c oxidase assembly protein [Novosphingobium sp.]MDP3908131.1 cytochrome c oxidase assembly protein [Novosphingobium sp.]